MISIMLWLVSAVLTYVCYVLATAIWSVYFGKLSAIPGPKLAAATRLVLLRHKAAGNAEYWRRELHLTYGDVVRVGPDEVSFANGSAWKEIYGNAPGSQLARFQKEKSFYNTTKHLQILRADDIDHPRHRKAFAPAFSDRALQQQTPLLQRHIAQLLLNIKQAAEDPNDRNIDMAAQYNFTTFDIMADLAFGESLGCLVESRYISWITTILSSLKLITLMGEVNRYPAITKFMMAIAPASLKEQREIHERFAAERVDKRLATETNRADMWHFVLASEEKNAGLSRDEMHENTSLFMIAGTETSATAATATTYYLLRHPDRMRILTDEIRSRFKSIADIQGQDLTSITYLEACIREAIRLHPPVPLGFPRVVPKGGAAICGYQLPEDTCVYVHQLSTYYNPKNFTFPTEFHPERWLSEQDQIKYHKKLNEVNDHVMLDFSKDDKSCLQPFSVGPRNCIGQNLAWREMRLILTSVLWSFDFALVEGTPDWVDRKIYGLWEPKGFLVKPKLVSR